MTNNKFSSWREEHSSVVDSLNNRNMLKLMWNDVGEIETEQPINLEIMLNLDKDGLFFDKEDHIYKKINKDGHRGPDFIKNVDILFSGCSQTYGQGVKDGTIWGEIVANHFGLTYNNLSYRGGSIMQSVYNIFNYCKKYGNPKYILCNFPSLIRTYVFVDSNIITAKPYEDILRKRYGSDVGPYRAIEVAQPAKYIKTPAKVDEVFSNEHRIWVNLMFISMLETYCKSHNIKLLWTNWIDVYDNKNKFMDIKFNNHFLLEDGWDKTVHPHETDFSDYNKCHQDIKNNYENFFDRGTDWEYRAHTDIIGHWGAHTHIHIAENFIKEIKNREL